MAYNTVYGTIVQEIQVDSLEQLRSWPELQATENQLACLDAVIEHGSPTAAARALGTSRSTVRSAIARIKLKA